MKNLIIIIAVSIFLCSCGDDKTLPETAKIDNQEIERLNDWFATVFERDIMDSPEFLSDLGRKDRQSELDDISEAHSLNQLEQHKKDLEKLLTFDVAKLDEQTTLSYRLFKRNLERSIKYDRYRYYSYPVNQMHGMQSGFPSFMLNKHNIENKADGLAYVGRLTAAQTKFNQLLENLKIREEKGIIPPKFVFNHLYNDCNNIIGSPDKLSENLFLKDITSKLSKIEISEADKEDILQKANKAILENVIPSYQKLITYLKELELKATTDDGVWKFADGENFYNYRLEEITTTELTGDEIFTKGMEEVERIHKEMEGIMKAVKFEGSLQDFFKFMKEDQQFYYPDSEEGKAEMLLGYQAIVDNMEAKLDEVFYTKPKARMEVKAVEAWREQSAGKAFYQSGTPDGSRKGAFYANLYKMADMPKFEMEALAYHEGIPGHHMQISIAQELTDLPEFRKYSHYTAYVEGWGLYCELLPKEMGFYQDPYSDFGRLAMEIWRACRLVVDVGIHQKKWSREKAIQFLVDNTPASENGCTKAIERYIVMPGQATAYKVGMLHILKMRAKAKEALGDQFDIRKFHDIFLRSGGVPLEIYEEQIDAWIVSAKK
jgi:uncharacterized protein (DUF885 family)